MQIKLIQVNQDKSSQQIIAITYFIYLFFLFFGHTKRHVGFQFPDQGLNPCPCKWKLGVRTVALPGKSQKLLFKLHKHDLYRSCGKMATAVLLLFLKKNKNKNTIQDSRVWEGCSTFTGSWKSSQSDCSVHHACWNSWFHCLCKVLISKDCTLLVFIKVLPS